MNPWLSWAIVLGAAGALWWYYTRSNKTQVVRGRSNTGSEAPLLSKVKKDEKVRRKPGQVGTSDLSGNDGPIASAVAKVESVVADATTQRKTAKTKPTTQPGLTSFPASEPEDDSSDRQWAEQLARARKGTNLTVPSKESGRTKTVKASAANNTSSDFSSASSTGGADADDDLTPGISPTIRAGDVSDMLEPKKAGPSVLRLTEPSNPVPQRAPRPQKEFQVAETKKQRQNRKKNEDRKAANHEAESERQSQLEKQRRAAREARGEPAKNGLQQAKAPSSSAWAGNPQSSQTTTSTPIQPVQSLLDTFDRTEAPAVGGPQNSLPPTNGGVNHSDFSNGMTEEQQFNLASKISEDEDGWNTVATKKGKKQPDAQGAKPLQQSQAPLTSRLMNGFASLPDEE